MTILYAGVENSVGNANVGFWNMTSDNTDDVEPLDLDFSDRDFSVLSFSPQTNGSGICWPTSWIDNTASSSVSQRNDREEIRRKLAMGGLEEDYYGGERSYKKPNLSKRLQSGMNLQICFMNESPGEEPDPIKSSPQKSDLLQEEKTELGKLESTDVKTSAATGSNPDLSDNKMSVAAETKSAVPGGKQMGDEDFFKKQARLQREAKIALAQASTMAHMQLEVEKQKKKKSPVTDIVGLPLLGDRIMSWGNKPLHEMNLAQLQVLVNDLHSQIEKLNEDLVRLLMERDELHMGQDSMLVDIEDLTRRAEDKAKRFNTQTGKKGGNSKRS